LIHLYSHYFFQYTSILIIGWKLNDFLLLLTFISKVPSGIIFTSYMNTTSSNAVVCHLQIVKTVFQYIESPVI